MAQIPVKDTIVRTYRYTFDNFRILFGLTWLAALASTALDPLANVLGKPDGGSVGVVADLVWFLIYVAIYSIAAVVVTRQALGVRSGFTPFHFAFGKAEWQLFVASVGCTAATTAAVILSSIGIAIASVAVGAPPAFGGILIFGVILAGLVFVGVRYLFFLPLAAVLSPDQRLERSYDLSAGNFWAILAIGLAATVPATFVALVSSLPELLSQLVSALKDGLHWPTGSGAAVHEPTSIVSRITTLGVDFITTILNWALIATAAVFASEAFHPSRNASNEA